MTDITPLIELREHNIAQLDAFETEHEALLNQHRELNSAIRDAEGQIRALAANEGAEEIVYAHTRVCVQRKAAPKSFDAVILLANCPELKSMPGVIKTTADSTKVQALGKKGVIPQKVMDAALVLGKVPAPTVTIETVAGAA